MAATAAAVASKSTKMYYRMLGNTGLQVSVLSYGLSLLASLPPSFTSSSQVFGQHLVQKKI
jgi:aryl-alcohol dehydrogenase-like predicted oxidoreductase